MKTHMIRVRIDPVLLRELRWAAARRKMDVSTYLRQLAARDIDRLKRRTR